MGEHLKEPQNFPYAGRHILISVLYELSVKIY